MRVAGVQVKGMCAYAFPFGQWGRCSLKHPHLRLFSIEQLHHFLGFALDSNHPRQITFVHYSCKSIEKRAGCTPGNENKPVVTVASNAACARLNAGERHVRRPLLLIFSVDFVNVPGRQLAAACPAFDCAFYSIQVWHCNRIALEAFYPPRAMMNTMTSIYPNGACEC